MYFSPDHVDVRSGPVPTMEVFWICRKGLDTQSIVEASEQECTPALAQFAMNDLITGESQLTQGDAAKSTSEQGYSVPSHFFTERQISVCPLPGDTTLQMDGMQISNVRDALEVEGITQHNIDITRKE